MGSLLDEAGRDADETRHNVTLTRAFYMQATEVSQEHWQARMGNNPSRFSSDLARPVEQVSWYDALAFANAQSVVDGLPVAYGLSSCSGTPGTAAYACREVVLTSSSPYAALGWRLPTEAEWEYACRGGVVSAWFFGGTGSLLADYGWFGDNSDGTSHPVGQKRGNAQGLKDMAGNVWEWCWDIYGAYPGDATDPVGNAGGTERINRGGSWSGGSSFARSAERRSDAPASRFDDLGFRLVRSLP